MARGAIGAGDAGRASVSRGLHLRPATHPRLWAGMLRVRTRTTPLKPAWTAGRGVIRLGADCGPSLLGPVRLRRTPPRFAGFASPVPVGTFAARGFPPGGPTGVAPPAEPSAGRRPANRGGRAPPLASPTGRGYAPHQNRAAGASLKASPRLAPGRWTRPPLRGRWQAFFRRLPLGPCRPFDPACAGREGPPAWPMLRCRLHPPAKRAGPVPMLDPLPRSRAPIGPRHGEAAPPPACRSARGGPLGVPPRPKYSARLWRAPLWAAPRCCVCAAMKPGGFKPPKLRGR